MRIALIVPGGVDRSGEYRVVPALLALIERLSAHHDVHVFAMHQEPRPATWTLLGAVIHNIGAGDTRVRALQGILREHRSSAFDLVHGVWGGMSGFVAVLSARLIGRPSLVHLAGGELVSLPALGYGGRRRWVGRIQESLVLRGATMLTAASSPMIESVRHAGFVAERVPLGVDVRVWPVAEPRRRDTTEFASLIHVASLNRVKDQPCLLRAMAYLAEWDVGFELDVIGEDTLHGEVQGLARELGISSRVRFHGFLTQRQLLPLVRAAHVMIISSRHEAGPLAMLEAAVQGVPTVGTAVGHIAEWAPEGAVAVSQGDPEALAHAVRELLQSEDCRLRIAREAQRRAIKESADYTATRFEALYEKLARERLDGVRPGC
ncbi:MAG: glycosyltransferase family 4 protein [Steroidobacteraceae bacterium]